MALSVLFVDHTCEPGGAELALARMLERTEALDATLATFGDGVLAERARGAGVPVITTPRPFSFRRLPAAFRHVRRAVRQANPDVIVSNSMIGSGLMLGVPRAAGVRVMMLRDFVRGGYYSWLPREVVARLIIPSHSHVIANSEATAASIPVGSLARTKVDVSSPVSGVTRVAGARTRTATSGPLRVLSLSRLQRWKGIHDLVEAVGLVVAESGAERITLTVAGGSVMAEERYETRLQSRAAELGISADFVGHVSDVSSLLANHDVVVVASETPEPFGQIVPQALAAALPVVATAHGGPAAILAGSAAGRLVPPSDPRSMADALAALAADAPTWNDASAEAARLAMRYTDESTVARWEQLVTAAYDQAGPR